MRQLTSVRDQKIRLRKKFKAVRLALEHEQKKMLDERIFNRLISIWAFKECETVFCYASTPIEVDTFQFIEYSLSLGKKIALPYCIENSREMDFYYIKSLDDLKIRTFHVYEPIAQQCEKVTDFSKGVCVVPALAYDQSGYRLGYGKGYYDRFLARFGGETIGICYSSCVVPLLPHGKYDKHVDLLLTEKWVKPVSG